MSGISKLRIVDTQGDVMSCDLSGHNLEIESELTRKVAGKVSAFYKKAKTEGLVATHFIRDKDVNVRVFEDDDERLWIDLTSSTGKNKQIEIDLEANPDLEDLAEDAREIIDIVRGIWAKHDHSTHKHARSDSRGRSRAEFDEPVPLRSKPRSKLDERLRAARTNKATGRHFKLPDEIAKARSKAIKYCREADDIVVAHNQGKPTIVRATKHIQNIRDHQKVLGRLINRAVGSEGLKTELEHFADLENLQVMLSQKASDLEALNSRKDDFRTFATVYERLNPLVAKMQLADPSQTDELVEEFHRTCVELCHSTDDPSAHALINSIVRQTYFYAHGLDPQFRDLPSRNREGQELFTNRDLEGHLLVGNAFSNEMRGLALKYSLMHHFATQMQHMSAENVGAYREIFATLPNEKPHQDQRNILLKFAEIMDVPFRGKPEKEIQESLKELYTGFLGNEKTGEFLVALTSHEPRREAIYRWIQEELFSRHGKNINALLHDNEQLHHDLEELQLDREHLQSTLEDAQSKLRRSGKELREAKKELLTQTQHRQGLERELDQLQRKASQAEKGAKDTQRLLEDRIRILTEENRELQLSVGRLQNTIRDHELAADDLNLQIASLEERLLHQGHDLESATKERDLLKLQALETARTRQQLESRIEELLLQNGELLRGKEDLLEQIRLLRLTVSQKDNEAHDLNERIASLESQLRTEKLGRGTDREEAQRQLQLLRTQVDDVTREAEDTQRLLLEQLRDLTEGNKQLQSQVGALQKEADTNGRLAREQGEKVIQLEALLFEKTQAHEKAQRELEELQLSFEEAEDTIVANRRQIADLLKENLLLGQELSELTEFAEAKRNEALQLTAHVKQLETSLAIQSEAREKAERSLEQLQLKFDRAAEEALRAQRGLQEEIDRLKDENEDQGAIIEGLGNKLERQTILATRLAERVDLQQADIVKKTRAHEEDKLRLRELQHSFNEAAKKARSAQHLLQDSVDALTLENQKLGLTVGRLQDTVRDHERQADDLNLQIASLRERILHQGHDLESATKERDQLRLQALEAGRTRRQLESRIEELLLQNGDLLRGKKDLLDQIRLLRLTASQKDDEAHDLNERIALLESQLRTEKLGRGTDREEAERELKILRAQVDKVTREAVEAEQLLSDKLRVLTEGMELLQSRVVALQEEANTNGRLAREQGEKVIQLEAQLLEKTQAHGKAQLKLEELQHSFEEAEDTIVANRRQIASLVDENSQLGHQLAEKTLFAEEKRKEALQSAANVKRLEVSLAHSTEAHEADKRKLEALELDHAAVLKAAAETEHHLNHEIDLLKEKNAEQGLLIEDLQRQLREKSIAAVKLDERARHLESTLQDENQARLKAERQLQDLQPKAKRAIEEARQAREELAEAQLGKKSLEEQLADLRRQLLEQGKRHFVEIQDRNSTIDAQKIRIRTLDLSIRDNEAAFEDHKKRCVEAELRVHGLADELELVKRRNLDLESLLKEQQEVVVVATREMGTQTGNDVVELDLSGRVSPLNLLDRQDVVRASEIDELDLDDGAFGLLSDAVKEGRIDMLLEEQGAPTRQNAPAALLTLLQKNPANANDIYNLAIFVAHRNPEMFGNRMLASTMQNWLMFRVGQPEIQEIELRKLNTLVEAFKASHLDEMAEVTGTAVQRIEAMKKILSRGQDGTPHQRWTWAANALIKLNKGSALSDVERVFAIKLKNALGAVFKGNYRDPIVNPDASNRKGKTQTLTLEQQLCRVRQGSRDPSGLLSVDSRGGKTVYSYFTGAQASIEEYPGWLADVTDRESTILALIEECADFRTWHDVNLSRLDVPILELEVGEQLLVPQPLEDSAVLTGLEREYTEARQGLIENRQARVARIEEEITQRLSQLTGLRPNDPRLCAPRVISQVLQRELPVVLDNVLCQDGGREFFILAQLVYWHSALSNWNDQLPNPRAQQSKFAIPSDWSWLMERDAATYTDYADRLLTVTNHLRHHPKLQGSPLTPFQVKWAEKLSRLLLQKEPSAIYDEAGAGKTDTADFTLGLLQDVFRGEQLPEVHWLTPFAPRSEVPGAVIPGVTMHQLPKFSGKIEVRVGTPHAVVLVDEGHKLVPESADLRNPETGHVSIVLKTPDEHEIPVQWLSMTATPVVPAIPLGMEQEFSGRTVRDYSREIERLTPELEKLLRKREQHLPELKIGTKKKRIQVQARALMDQYDNIKHFHAEHRDLMNILPKSVDAWIRNIIEESTRLNQLIPAKEANPTYQQGLRNLFARPNGSAIKLTTLLKHLCDNSVDKAVRAQERIVGQQKNAPVELSKLKLLQEEQRRTHALIDPIIENLQALQATLITPSSEIQGPYIDDEFTRDIDHIQGLLEFYQSRVDKLEKRSATIERFEKTREELAQQGKTPSPMQMLELGFTEEQAFAMTLPAKREEHFATVDYHQRALGAFNPGSVGASLDIGLEQLVDANAPALQLIFPGVRFTDENFTEDFLGNIVQRFAGKEVHMLYHDSHSAGTRGKDILKIYGADGVLIATHVLDNLEQARALIAQREAPSVNIMLYDSTNQQGGDFGAFSRVSGPRPIDQIVFYDLTDNVDRNPSLLSTANDAYQALRRRRGISERPPVLLASLPKLRFFEAINSQQAIAERYHAAGVAANQIAKRLLKIVARGHDPKYSLKEKSIEQIRMDVARMKNLPKLAKAADLTEHLREQLLTGRHESEELGTLQHLAGEVKGHVDDPVLAAKIAHTGAKIDFYTRWVREIR